jgi:hypothetical protein
MSKRLQVLLDEVEFRELRLVARRHRVTVAEWVRQALRAARRQQPERDAGRKLAAVRSAAEHAYPTAAREAVPNYVAGGPRLAERSVTALDLAARWPSLPRLTPGDAAALEGDIAAARKKLPAVRAPWA